MKAHLYFRHMINHEMLRASLFHAKIIVAITALFGCPVAAAQCVAQIVSEDNKACTIAFTVDSAGAIGSPTLQCDSLIVLSKKLKYALTPRMQRADALNLSHARIDAVLLYEQGRATRWSLDATSTSSLRDAAFCISQSLPTQASSGEQRPGNSIKSDSRSPGLMIAQGAHLKNGGIVVALLAGGIAGLMMTSEGGGDPGGILAVSLAGVGISVSLSIAGNSMQAKAGNLLFERGY